MKYSSNEDDNLSGEGAVKICHWTEGHCVLFSERNSTKNWINSYHGKYGKALYNFGEGPRNLGNTVVGWKTLVCFSYGMAGQEAAVPKKRGKGSGGKHCRDA